MSTTPSGALGKARRGVPRWVIPVAGYCVSVACLIWVYYGFDWRSELPKLMATDWRWVAVAAVTDLWVYVCQGWRWNLILQPLGRPPLVRTIQAVYIGLFANEILPLRSGEVIRCYLLSRWSALPFSLILSTAVIERLIDGLWLILGFYATSRFLELPGFLVAGGRVLTIILLVLAGVLVIIILHKSHAQTVVSGSRWSRILHHLVDALHKIGNSPSFVFAGLVSLLYLVLQVVPVYALLRGYGLDLPLGAAAVVLIILRVGSIPPQAPGNIGSFQFFTILGLQLFGVSKTQATGFATLLFVVVTVPLWLGGFIALVATRMRLHEIHRDAHDTLSEGSRGSNAGT